MSSIAPGTRIGPYEVVGAIAAGGMGEVYRARDPRLQRDVAIKVLPTTYSSDPDRLRRFELEARAAGQLAHPNIPAIYDTGTYLGSPYVVSELLEGETLRQRLRGRPLPPRKAAEIALQIARGLSAVKEMGLVHRDLKPENVFLTRDGQVKILDFGLAKLVQPEAKRVKRSGWHRPRVALTQEGLIVGTAGYMSPEQVRGEPVDHRSDIFAFGLIVYEMLTGRRAFWRDNPVQTLHAILEEEPPDPQEVNSACPPGLARIVRHCMEKNPRERFQSASDVGLALEDALAASSGPSPAAPATPPGAPRPRLRPGAWRKPTGVALLLAAGAVAGFALAKVASRGAAVRFEQVTFRRGVIWSARFAPDGRTVVYGAAWDGKPMEVFSSRVGAPEARSLGLVGADVLSVSREGDMALSLNRQYRGVWVQTGTLARASLSGGQPRELLAGVEWADFTPDGAELAVVRFADGRDRLEFPIGNVVYSTAGWIGHPRVSPKGDRVAFFDHPVWTDDGGSLAVVDRAGRVTTLVNGLTSAQGLAWAPDGLEVWFTASDGSADRAIRSVSLRGRQRLLLQAPAELTLYDVAADGRVLFARESWRGGIVARAPGDTRLRDLSWLDYSLVRDISADGRRILFTEGGRAGGASYGAYLRDTDASPPVRLSDGDAAALSPDGMRAITLTNGAVQQLILQPTGAGTARAITNDSINHLRARWFPDGTRVAFAGHEPGRGIRIFVQALSGGTPRGITPEGIGLDFAVSPDGRHVAVVSAEQRIAIYPVEGGEPQTLPSLTVGLTPIRWTGDGRGLVVFGSVGLPGEILSYDLASGRTERLHEIELPDPAGFVKFNGVFTGSEGASYACSYLQVLAELFVAEGVR